MSRSEALHRRLSRCSAFRMRLSDSRLMLRQGFHIQPQHTKDLKTSFNPVGPCWLERVRAFSLQSQQLYELHNERHAIAGGPQGKALRTQFSLGLRARGGMSA